jgi:tetratricopeptide (TPR) repeat protein
VLETRYADRVAEQVEWLAHHAVRGEVWAKAVTYGRQAGQKAFDCGAFREAVTGYEQALDALGHLPETPETGGLAIALRICLAGGLLVLGAYQRNLALLGEAEARARQLDDRARLGWVLSMMSMVRRIVGNLEGALAASQQALELAATLGDPALQAEASYQLGGAYFGMGDFSRAAEVLRGNVEALARGTPGGVRQWGILSQACLAWVLSTLGEFAEGRRHGESALRLAMAEGRGTTPTIAHACLGLLSLAQGDLEAAVRVLDRGLALCRASGNRVSEGLIVGGLGEAYAHTGRVAEGLALLEEARRDDLRTGSLDVTLLRQLSAVYLLAGCFDEGWQYACQALDLARQQRARGEETLALFQLGAVHAHASPPDVRQAKKRYREALALAEKLGMRPLQAHCRLALGTLYRQLGRREEAKAALSAAIELYRAMEMTFWLPQAEAALAEVEGR